jgi:hypothetical protein
MKLTISILILPVVIFLAGISLIPRGAGFIWIQLFLGVWALASLLCFIHGFFIFRQHQRLAWCCFVVATVQLVLAILPALASHRL